MPEAKKKQTILKGGIAWSVPAGSWNEKPTLEDKKWEFRKAVKAVQTKLNKMGRVWLKIKSFKYHGVQGGPVEGENFDNAEPEHNYSLNFIGPAKIVKAVVAHFGGAWTIKPVKNPRVVEYKTPVWGGGLPGRR
jgi:hypothetical protein